MAQPQKETILGNYTSFPRFPLDCESMEYIQENIKHLAIVAQIAGCDKLIIKGCTGNSQSRTEGYVYVRTGDDLVGEILYSPAGSGVRCDISTENINATANNETFTSAYTIRKLVSGTTGEWSWSDFRALSEITNSALKTLVDGKAAAGHNHDAAYAAKNHGHNISEIVNLQSALDGKAAAGHNHDTVYSKLGHNHDTAYAAKSHNHSISEIINLQSALDGKSAVGHTHNYSASGHTHDDRYYTKSDWAVSSGQTDYYDNKYHVYWRQQGKVVTLCFSSVSLVNTSNNYCKRYINAPTPAVNVKGVGFGFLGSGTSGTEMSAHPNNTNLMPFTFDTAKMLHIGNFGSNTQTFDATITYITSD